MYIKQSQKIDFLFISYVISYKIKSANIKHVHVNKLNVVTSERIAISALLGTTIMYMYTDTGRGTSIHHNAFEHVVVIPNNI